MSIPKEPRQLMINLMYLVLTALLALNVSAEVMNAFFSLDKGMADSGKIIDRSNGAVMESINKQASAYDNPTNRKYSQNATKAKELADEFVNYIEQHRTFIFEKAGGANPKVAGQPKDIRNKDLTTKYFINDGKGKEIQTKIEDLRKQLLELADNDPAVGEALPLVVEPVPQGVKASNWPEFKFKQMPVAAIFPTLGKLQSDAKSSYATILNYCAKKVSGEEEIRFDSYEPVVSATKSYMIVGETYEADVFLSAYSSTANNVSISVNGSSLPVQSGKAKYSARADGIGTKKFGVTVNVKNPLTGAVKTYQKDFTYEVGQRSIAVALTKMNVFYIGVDNPVAVSAAGINTADLRVSANGVNISKVNGSNYVVRATTPGEATITVAGPGVSQTFNYRVKRIPDPVATLGMKHKGGTMASGEFRAQGGIIPVLENFDFEAKCDVVGFTATYLAKRQDPSPPVTNPGPKWNGTVQGYVSSAKPGDSYFFDDIKVKCPGDAQARNIGGLAFKIR
jgi:gliding motility-associated protein GldM